MRCKEILTEYGIISVEIAFRESIVTRSGGPRLLDHTLSIDPTVDIRSPFTPTLGLKISLKDFPYFEGTGGSNRVLLLTARHAVLPLKKYSNSLYHRKNNSTPRREVIHLGSKAYQTALEAISHKMANETAMVDTCKNEITALGEVLEGEDVRITRVRNAFGVEVVKAEESNMSMDEFYGNITKFWTEESQRVLGHVLYAPPISSDKQFTEDWALVELNRGKFDLDTFQGNAIDIATFRYIGKDRSVGMFLI